ncbi:MAG: hypothetical protein RMY34_29830 [Aulosira sp. DedQUE10]|nr:hypothetical protein [Aulosira sp. DedQUE10]
MAILSECPELIPYGSKQELIKLQFLFIDQYVIKSLLTKFGNLFHPH